MSFMVKDKVINLSLILSLSHRQTQLMSLNPINMFDFTVNLSHCGWSCKV